MKPFIDRDVYLAEGPERRFREAVHLQEIEANPFTADDFAMFAMFDRERFSDEERLAFTDLFLAFRRDGLSLNQQLSAFRAQQKAADIVDAAE